MRPEQFIRILKESRVWLAVFFLNSFWLTHALAEPPVAVHHVAAAGQQGLVVVNRSAPKTSAHSLDTRRCPLELLAKGNYTPIPIPSVVYSEEIAHQTYAEKRQLKSMGVEFEEIPLRPIFSNRTRVTPTNYGEVHPGRILKITKVPPPYSSGSWLTPALFHPELADYRAKLENMGITLVVDTSMTFKHYAGYFSAQRKLLAIQPGATWGTFLHEFQHAEFEANIAPYFDRMVGTINAGRNITDAVPKNVRKQLGEKKLQRLSELIRMGLPQLAVNETLSRDVELEAPGAWRYVFFQPGVRKYALRHQITGLEDLPIRSPTQNQTLSNAKLNHALLTTASVGMALAPAALLSPAFLALALSSQRGRVAAECDEGGYKLVIKPDGTPILKECTNAEMIAQGRKPMRTPVQSSGSSEARDGFRRDP